MIIKTLTNSPKHSNTTLGDTQADSSIEDFGDEVTSRAAADILSHIGDEAMAEIGAKRGLVELFGTKAKADFRIQTDNELLSIHVALDWDDTYAVTVLTGKGTKELLKKSQIPFDRLGLVIRELFHQGCEVLDESDH